MLVIYILSRVSQHYIKKIERNIRRCFLHLVQSVHYCGQLQPAAHPLVQIFENLWIFLKFFEYFCVSLQSHYCFALDIFEFFRISWEIFEYFGKYLNILENLWILLEIFAKSQLLCTQYLEGMQETTSLRSISLRPARNNYLATNQGNGQKKMQGQKPFTA